MLIIACFVGFVKRFSKSFLKFFLTTRLGVPSPYILIIAHSASLVNTFFKKFWKIFWNNLPPSAYPFTVLQLVSVGFVWGVSPPDMIIIPHPLAEVKHFGKNKKINIFAKTLDKFCEPWYNREFGPRRM